jgi:hypothetical protein
LDDRSRKLDTRNVDPRARGTLTRSLAREGTAFDADTVAHFVRWLAAERRKYVGDD